VRVTAVPFGLIRQIFLALTALYYPIPLVSLGAGLLTLVTEQGPLDFLLTYGDADLDGTAAAVRAPFPCFFRFWEYAPRIEVVPAQLDAALGPRP